MGAVEEGAKLAGGFMDALKREPLSLALVFMNLALLGFFWLILNAVAAQREREVNLMYEDKKEVRELIAKCVVPPAADRRTEQLKDDDGTVVVEWPPLPRSKPVIE